MSRVDHPDHYQTSAGLEAVDVIEAFFHDNFHLGNAFKYLARAGKKGDYVEDLRKSIWYLQREIDRHSDADDLARQGGQGNDRKADHPMESRKEGELNDRHC